MLFKQMQYFISIVKNNSFTEAAEENYISQSAISQAIKSLEDELGVKLLKRKNRSFSLTDAGEYFYKQSLIMVDEVNRLKQAITKISTNKNDILRIGYINNYCGFEIYNAIMKFSQIYPDIDIEVHTGNHEELYEQMKNDKLDIVINDQRRALSEEYINHYLYRSSCYIEISNKSLISKLKEVTFEDLKKIPCIIITSKNQQEIESEYYGNTLGFDGNFLFAENLDEARMLVAANKGFLPLAVTPKQKETMDGISRILLVRNGERVERNYYAFWNKMATNILKEEFANILEKEYIQDK